MYNHNQHRRGVAAGGKPVHLNQHTGHKPGSDDKAEINTNTCIY